MGLGGEVADKERRGSRDMRHDLRLFYKSVLLHEIPRILLMEDEMRDEKWILREAQYVHA